MARTVNLEGKGRFFEEGTPCMCCGVAMKETKFRDPSRPRCDYCRMRCVSRTVVIHNAS